MRLRARPLLFADLLADAATARPFLRALLQQRRAAPPAAPRLAPPSAPLAPPLPVPEAA